MGGITTGESGRVGLSTAVDHARASSRPDLRRWAAPVASVLALLALNYVIWILPIDYEGLGQLAIPGAFLVALISNLAVVVPVPYIPIIANLATNGAAPFVALAAAFGSVLGESVAFLAGRLGAHDVLERAMDPVWRDRLHRVLTDARISGPAIFLLALVPNPFFDAAGLACGALDVRYRVFFVAALLGRLGRFFLIVWVGIQLNSAL